MMSDNQENNKYPVPADLIDLFYKADAMAKLRDRYVLEIHGGINGLGVEILVGNR